MKVSTLLISLILSLSNSAWAGPSDTEHKPMHGGVLVTVKDIDYELVANPTALRLFVRDHGKPVDVSKTTAKLTLLSGTEARGRTQGKRRQVGGVGQFQSESWHKSRSGRFFWREAGYR